MFPKFTAVDASNFLNVTLQAIHKSLRTKKLDFEKTQNRVFFGHSAAKEIFDFHFSPKTIAFQIVKGGTGKTSIAQATAIRANLYGARILCIDMDQQANLTQSFHVNSENVPVMVDVLKEKIDISKCIVNISEGLDIIPSRIENATIDSVIMLEKFPLDRVYRQKLDKLKSRYDLIIIDCPPALGQSVAAVALSSDMVIAPVTPEEFSLSGLKISNEEIKNIEDSYGTHIPLKLILNKFDTRTALSHETLSSLIKDPIFGAKMFKTYIRMSQEFPNCITKGISVYDSIRTTTAKEDIDLFTREILDINPPLKKDRSSNQKINLAA